MTREMKQEFTLRITQANKTQMITILYEMVLLYIDEAEQELESGNRTEYKAVVRRIQGCMDELKVSLNLNYDVAHNLLQLYRYIDRELIKAASHYERENLEHVRLVIDRLHKAYEQIESQDTSEPVMGNTQTVYAGLTYGRNTLTENITDPAANRGFCV